MKKLLTLLSVSALLIGCTGDEPVKPTPPTPEADKITLTSGTSLTLQSEESTGTITFNSNVSWKASATESWVELSPASGAAGSASITVKVKENDSTDERNASVTITGGKASASVTIAQKQKDALILSTNKIEIGGVGGEFEVDVKSNVSVQHTIDVDWIKLVSTKAMTTSKMTFAVEESEEKEKREGTIKFTAGNLKEEIKVYQAEGGDIFVLSQKEYELTKEEQEIKIELRSNIGFSTIEIPQDVDWITEVQTKASSTYTKYLLISENSTYDDRAAKVDIFNGDKSKKETVSIWQSQTDSLGVVKSEYEVTPEGGLIEVDVHHNVDFTVEIPADVDWVKRVDTKGVQSTKVQFEIAENDGSADRECTITIKGKDIERTIIIKQNAVHTKRFYTSTDGKIVEPTQLTAWDIDENELKFTNTYGEDGGVIEFEGEVHTINLSFNSFSNPNMRLLSFDGISNMVYLESVYAMFASCRYLQTADLSNFNTENATTMWGMFQSCSSLKTVDLSNFNTENVTNMFQMFLGCSSLKSLNLSNFNTENVMDIGSMFTNCSSLKSLDLSSFNTKNVRNMFQMFLGCSSLKSLNLSNFNTENVTDMSKMFQLCSALKTIDLNNINTENVTNMSEMFEGCSSLQSLDLSSFNTENVTNMWRMFEGCSSLQSLDVSSFNTKNVTDMNDIFAFCSSLKSLDVSGFNTENVTDMRWMFGGCSALKSLDVSRFNTENVTNMALMFCSCSSLQSLDLSNFNTENVEDMNSMFSGCSSLQTLDVSRFNTENVTNMLCMFLNCSSLISLDISNFNTENVEDMNSMFSGCSSLQTLDVSEFNTENVTNMYDMFASCSSLQTLDLSNFNTENATDMRWLFIGCSSLKNLIGGEGTNKGKVDETTFSGIGRNGTLFYPQGCDYSEWLSDEYLGFYGWTGQTY